MMYLFALFILLLVALEASKVDLLPYYIKMQLYAADKQNYKSIEQKVNDIMEGVMMGKSIMVAQSLLRRYLKNCDKLVERWLMRQGDHCISYQIKYDPSLVFDQAAIENSLTDHSALIVCFLRNIPMCDTFAESWMYRVSWMQEFVDALLTTVMLGMEQIVYPGMVMLKELVKNAMDWLALYENGVKRDGYNGFIRPPQGHHLMFSRYGYWTPQELGRLRNSGKNTPYDLVLKNAQYYRALTVLDVSLYSFEDVENFVQVSKMFNNPQRPEDGLQFLIVQMEQWSKQVKERWEREKQTQLKANYTKAKLMRSPWYGLTLPSQNVLKVVQGIMGEILIDFFNFGLRGSILMNIYLSSKEAISMWDKYVSSLETIIRTVQPDLVDPFRRIDSQCREFLKIWNDPKTRGRMLKLQGYRPQGFFASAISDSQWKGLVLLEMAALGDVHPKIVEFIRSL